MPKFGPSDAKRGKDIDAKRGMCCLIINSKIANLGRWRNDSVYYFQNDTGYVAQFVR